MLQTLLGAGLGLIIAFVFYLMARTRSRINYQTSNLQIIGNVSLNLPQDFGVMLAGEKIENLHKSQIIFWNAGTTTIHERDIVQEDPLKVVFSPHTKIFDINVGAVSREVNKFIVNRNESNENEIILTFNFLDKKDGAMIEILHTESSIEPKITGSVKGLVDGIRHKGQIEYLNFNKRESWIIFIVKLGVPLIASLAIAGLVMFLIMFLKDSINEMSKVGSYISVVIGLYIPFLLFFNNFAFFRKKFPRSIKVTTNANI